jgi:hypothetical protein
MQNDSNKEDIVGGNTVEWSRLRQNMGKKLPLLSGYVHPVLLKTQPVCGDFRLGTRSPLCDWCDVSPGSVRMVPARMSVRYCRTDI